MPLLLVQFYGPTVSSLSCCFLNHVSLESGKILEEVEIACYDVRQSVSMQPLILR